jgi:hypothetical protein
LSPVCRFHPCTSSAFVHPTPVRCSYRVLEREEKASEFSQSQVDFAQARVEFQVPQPTTWTKHYSNKPTHLMSGYDVKLPPPVADIDPAVAFARIAVAALFQPAFDRHNRRAVRRKFMQHACQAPTTVLSALGSSSTLVSSISFADQFLINSSSHLPQPSASKTPQRRSVHLLRISNQDFDHSVLPPLETYFAQNDHAPGQSCRGLCRPHTG